MGVTTRGGARACVVDTGSTATRANAPPARGAAHTGAEREARGVVRDKQRRGLEVAEGPGATGATALLRDRGAKRSADAAPLGAEAASNARRRAGEAVTDVTSLPVRHSVPTRRSRTRSAEPCVPGGNIESSPRRREPVEAPRPSPGSSPRAPRPAWR